MCAYLTYRIPSGKGSKWGRGRLVADRRSSHRERSRPGAPERAADFGASVATAIRHRAHRPSAQRALTSFHRPATTRRFTSRNGRCRSGALSAFPCETEMRTKGLVRSSLRRRCCRLLPEFGPPAESSIALCAGRQPIRPVSSWCLVRRQTRPSRRRLQQPRA
jgi:hypothetical protein